MIRSMRRPASLRRIVKRLPVSRQALLSRNPFLCVRLVIDSMQKEIEAAVNEYWASVESLDPRRYSENFAPYGTLEDPVGTNAIQGTDAIAAFFRDGIQTWNIDRITPTIRQVIAGVGLSTEAVVAWTLTVHTKAGQITIIEGIGLFKFESDQTGGRLLLESVREFFNAPQFTSALGE